MTTEAPAPEAPTAEIGDTTATKVDPVGSIAEPTPFDPIPLAAQAASRFEAPRNEWAAVTIPEGLLPDDARFVKAAKSGFVGVRRNDEYGRLGSIVDFAIQTVARKVLYDDIVPSPAVQIPFIFARGVNPLHLLPVYPVVAKRAPTDGPEDKVTYHRIDPDTLQLEWLTEDASSVRLPFRLKARIEGTQLYWMFEAGVMTGQAPVPMSAHVGCSSPDHAEMDEQIVGLTWECAHPFTDHFHAWRGLGPMLRAPKIDECTTAALESRFAADPGMSSGHECQGPHEDESGHGMAYYRPMLGETVIGGTSRPARIEGYVLPLPQAIPGEAGHDAAAVLKWLSENDPTTANSLVHAYEGPVMGIVHGDGPTSWDHRLLATRRLPQLPPSLSTENHRGRLLAEVDNFLTECQSAPWDPSNVFRDRPNAGRKDVSGTGGQKKFGNVQGGEGLVAGVPLYGLLYQRDEVHHLRPGILYETDLRLTTREERDKLALWSRTIWHLGPDWGPGDMFGKTPLPSGFLPTPNCGGWSGKDDQHAGAQVEQIRAIYAPSRFCQLEANERIAAARLRHEDGSERGRGRMFGEIAGDTVMTGNPEGLAELKDSFANMLASQRKNGWLDVDGPVKPVQVVRDYRGLQFPNGGGPRDCTYGWYVALQLKGHEPMRHAAALMGDSEFAAEVDRYSIEITGPNLLAHFYKDPNTQRWICVDQMRWDGDGSRIDDSDFVGVGTYYDRGYHTTDWFGDTWGLAGLLAYLAAVERMPGVADAKCVAKAREIVGSYGMPHSYDAADWSALGPRAFANPA